MAKRFSRPVSVVGTSTLPQRYFNDPMYAGLSTYELWAYACHQALEDAGLKPQDVDKVVYSQMANFVTSGNILAPVGSLLEWIGMAGKPIIHVEQACASGYVAFMEACNSVASGESEIVLCAAIESPKHFTPRNQPAHVLKPISEYDGWWSPGRALFDTTYYRFDGVSDNLLTDEQGRFYLKSYGITEDVMDDTYNAMAVNLRRNASRNLRAAERVEYQEIARQKGFDDVMAYMRSAFNPKITQYLRKSGSVIHNVAAGALVVCSEDVAQRLGRKTVQVKDFTSVSNTQRHPYCFHQMNVDVRNNLVNRGLKTEEIDLLITTVMTSGEQLDSAEVFGYLPEGRGYQYELAGRTCFDGDTPINPHGGDLSFGHAFGSSGVNMLSEAVLQLRGEAGDCQVKKPIDQCLVRGMGGGHTTVGIVLGTSN